MKFPFVPKVRIKLSLVPRPGSLLRVFGAGAAVGLVVAAAVVRRLARPRASTAAANGQPTRAPEPTPSANAHEQMS
jgi:hypothetical protein